MTGEIPKKVDVLVVGAGPAGSTLARRLAAAGRDVLLIDKAVFPRRKPCGGGIPPRAAALFDLDLEKAAEGKVASVAVDGGWRGRLIFDTPGTYVVDRMSFDKLLVDAAAAAGARVAQGAAFLSIVSRDVTGFTIATSGGEVECRVLCACDGVFSPVARALGLQPPRLGFCLEGEAAMPASLDAEARSRAVFNIAMIEKGYAWAFPRSRKGVFNVGAGAAFPRFPALGERIGKFMARTPELAGAAFDAAQGGMIPDFDDSLAWYAKERAFLVGDAARLVDPLTGEGIAHAVRSATFAADAILSEKGEARYNELIDKELLAELRIARRAAEKFRKLPRLARGGLLALPMAGRYCALFVDLLSGKINYRELRRRVKGE